MAQANDIFVSTTNPAIVSLDGKCSLIEAIENANDVTVTTISGNSSGDDGGGVGSEYLAND